MQCHIMTLPYFILRHDRGATITWNYIPIPLIILSDSVCQVELHVFLNLNVCCVLYMACLCIWMCVYSYSQTPLVEIWLKQLSLPKFHLHKSKTHFYTHSGVTNSSGGREWEVANHRVSTNTLEIRNVR